MRFLWILASLLVSYSGFCQPSPLNRRAMAIAGLAPHNPTPCIASYTDPSKIPGLAFRWVAADGTNVGVVIDRVQNNYWVQTTPAKQPVLNGNHLDFDGSQMRFVTTNVTLTFEKNCSYYIIINTSNSPSDEVFFSIGNGTGGGGYIQTYTSSAKSAQWFENASSLSVAYSTNTLVDLIHVAENPHDKMFLNGVSQGAIATPGASFTATVVGAWTTTSGFIRASFYEFGVFTNTIFSDDLACSIHYYATNTYGFTP